MGTVTLRIVERAENGWWLAYIRTEEGIEHPVGGIVAGLRSQPAVVEAWEKLMLTIIDDFAAFHGLTEVISSTRTEVPRRGDA